MYIANKTDRQSNYNGKSPKFKNKNKNKNPKNGSERIAIQAFHFILVGTTITKLLPHGHFDNNGEKEIHVIALVTLIPQ